MNLWLSMRQIVTESVMATYAQANGKPRTDDVINNLMSAIRAEAAKEKNDDVPDA